MLRINLKIYGDDEDKADAFDIFWYVMVESAHYWRLSSNHYGVMMSRMMTVPKEYYG